MIVCEATNEKKDCTKCIFEYSCDWKQEDNCNYREDNVRGNK